MNVLDYMGGTPLVNIKNIFGDKYANIYVKLEEFNPAGSIKSRVALQMILDAEKQNKINKNSKLIEATGGNTGLGLAMVSAIRGYDLTLVIPDNFSKEKIDTLKQYGAKVVLSDSKTGVGSHIRLAEKMLSENPEYYCLDQFKNKSNPYAHYMTTGIEIIKQIENKINFFVAGIGSGGTISGVGKRLKEHSNSIKLFGVQPKGCDYFNNITVPHKIQAISVGVKSNFIEDDFIEGMLDVSYDEVNELRCILAKEQGIFVGLSSGANILASLNLSKQYDNTVNIVTIAPDSGKSYIN